MNSKNKGKRGERLFAEFLRDHGFQARRGQQFSGSPDSPDVVTNIENCHFEVKFTQKLNLHKAIQQATQDAGTKIPVVAHKRCNEDWYITLPADAFLHYVELASYNKPL